MPTNVLCATPCVKLGPATLQGIFTQTYAGSIDHHFTRHNPENVPAMNIVAAFQRLRALFLAGPWTHLWTVEDDMLIPPQALERLLAVGADIAYGVYVFRRGTPVVNVMRADTTDPLTNEPAYWAAAFSAGRVVPCAGLGYGCTLIARRVLERLALRTENDGGDSDTHLARDAKAAGFSQMAHTGVVCGHMRPDGVTLWPSAERPFHRRVGVSAPQLVMVRALISFGHWDENGMATVIDQGKTGMLDRELAANMAGRGQLEIMP